MSFESLSPLLSALGSLDSLRQIISSFSQSQRLLRVQFSPDADVAADALLPHQLTGSEGICEAVDYRLQCLSTSASIPLKALEGLPVACLVKDGEGTDHPICGLVTEAHQLGADGGFALYELRIQDALSVLKLRTTWRVFLGKSVIDITRQILDEHIEQNPVLASAFAYADGGLLGDYPAREFTLQAGESDYAFLTRIWRREGICWHYQHALDGDWPIHTLSLTDNAHNWQDNAAGSVRFHRADATEADDTITAFRGHRRLVASNIKAASSNYKTSWPSQTEQSTTLDQGDKGNALASTLTHYHFQSPHLADNDKHYAQMGRRWSEAQQQQGKWFSGEGVVRAFAGGVGSLFTLDGHPEISQHSPNEQRFVLTRIDLTVRNNLFHEIGRGGIGHQDDDAPFRVEFDCVRDTVPIAPEYDPACVPQIGPMSALVVGSGDAEIDVDEQGRIAVHFLFPQAQEHLDAGAMGTAADSSRIRVLQPLGDAGFGTSFHPRVGSEVLIQFLQNDPDKPVCVGNLRPHSKAPNRFDGLGGLPGNAALYGIRTKEVKGSGAGELLFDDTTGQIKTKLSSDHGNTAVNQGFITGPRRDGMATKRGEGMELRTDLAAAIRAAQGVLISADARLSATGKVLDRQELLGLEEAVQSIIAKLAELAETHGDAACDLKPLTELLDLLKQWEDRQGGCPVVAISAPAGIVQATPKTVTTSAGQHIHFTAVQDAVVSTGRKILLRAAQGASFFAHKVGMLFIAASGKISFQAQGGDIELVAAKKLVLTALEEIHLNAQKIFVTINGASMTLAEAMIELSAQSGVNVKASDFKFSNGGDGSVDMPQMPQSKLKTDEKIAFTGRAGTAREKVDYHVADETQATRDDGKTKPDGANNAVVKDTTIRPLVFKPKI